MVDVDLYFLGERNYVNGLTLFEEMLRAFSKKCRIEYDYLTDINIFKVNRFVKNHALIEVTDAEDDIGNKLKDVSARMKVRTRDQRSYNILLHEKKNCPVGTRIEDYDRGHYVSKMITDKEGNTQSELKNITNFTSLMRGLVEVNHRFCIEKAAEKNVQQGVSWAYLNDFSLSAFEGIGPKAKIQFNFDSLIKTNGKIFILRNFKIEKLTTGNPTEICFFFDDPDVLENCT